MSAARARPGRPPRRRKRPGREVSRFLVAVGMRVAGVSADVRDQERADDDLSVRCHGSVGVVVLKHAIRSILARGLRGSRRSS
jgi:hypothetical protein